MWHEARKHEKKLRGLMVDYRRRAERRREFYEKIRGDPALFLQIHGQQLKIHIDANISTAAENSLMPWMGDKDNMIDRFDVRAHLDYIPPFHDSINSPQTPPQTELSPQLERQINYERFRNLVQNEFLGLTETKYLQQIWLEERFGMNQSQKEQQQKVITKKKLAEKKATIAYNYEDEDSSSVTVSQRISDSSDSEDSSDEDYDFDTSVNIDQLNSEMGHRINSIAHKFGMKNDDFIRYLDEDKTEAEKIRLAKELENEKSMFTGRKSRRERRALKEQRLLILRATNVDESDKLSLKDNVDKHSQSSSESDVSVDETKIEFITSFGGSSEDEQSKQISDKKQKQVITKRKQKIKAIDHDISESTPLIYGPTLPGEDLKLSPTVASFNKNINLKKRSYRFNQSYSRSHSRSVERQKYNTHETSKRYRPQRSRSRSSDIKHSLSRTPDRYRRTDIRDYRYRRRSHSRDRNRKSRSRSRSRTRNTNRSRSRSRTRTTRRSRNRSRNRSRSRSRNSRSNDHKIRSRRKSRSRSRKRKRNESRSRSRRKSNSRSRGNSTNRTVTNYKQKRVDSKRSDRMKSRSRSSDRSMDSETKKQQNLDDIIIPEVARNKSRSKSVDIQGNGSQILSQFPNADVPQVNIVSDKIEDLVEDDIKSEQLNKDTNKSPSPPVKSYYRHDLCNTSSEDESEKLSVNRNLNQTSSTINEGSKKSTTVSSNNYGYKSSTSATPHERLKKKMQALIDKQYKLDKKAELEKLEKREQERVDREEELREMTYKLKYRRDAYYRSRNSRSSSRSVSPSSSSSY